MVRKFSVVVCAVMLLAICACAYAAEGSVTQVLSIPLSKTNWSKSILIPCFNESLGTLKSVDVSLYGKVQGTGKFESEDSESADITAIVKTLFQFKAPDGSVLLTLDPLKTYDFLNVAAYDEITDFAGDSGRSWDISVDGSNAVTLDSGNFDLSLFKQPAGLSMPVIARASTSISSWGNVTSVFTTKALADITVTYHYDLVPEPGSLCALLVGVAGFGIFRIRKR